MSKFTFGTEKRLKSKYEFAKVFEAAKDLGRTSNSRKNSTTKTVASVDSDTSVVKVTQATSNDNQMIVDKNSPELLSESSSESLTPNTKGYRFANNYFSILAINAGHEKARLGLVVAKKNLRYAVQRNRFKRLTREFFRLHPELFALDYVVMARSGFVQIAEDAQQVFFEFDRAFNHLKRQAQKS